MGDPPSAGAAPSADDDRINASAAEHFDRAGAIAVGRALRADTSLVQEAFRDTARQEDRGRAIKAPIIEGNDAGGRVDLSSIDFGKLATRGATASGFARATKP